MGCIDVQFLSGLFNPCQYQINCGSFDFSAPTSGAFDLEIGPYCWFASDVTAAMLVVKNKSISLRWEMNSILMQISQKNFFSFDHQHGRLVTWLQTKNSGEFDQSFLKKSNVRGFSRGEGAWLLLELTQTLFSIRRTFFFSKVPNKLVNQQNNGKVSNFKQ